VTGKHAGKQARKAPRTAWKPGQSGNLKGRPKGDNSWAATIRAIGELTPAEAARKCHAMAGQLAGLGDKITLREAVVIRVYTQMLFEPMGSLWGHMMDRSDGKVPIPVDVSMTWREELERLGYDPDQLKSEAVEQFAALVASHSAQRAGSPDGGGVARGEA
jgi:hypothetical protein